MSIEAKLNKLRQIEQFKNTHPTNHPNYDIEFEMMTWRTNPIR